jgi:hypothetical protein
MPKEKWHNIISICYFLFFFVLCTIGFFGVSGSKVFLPLLAAVVIFCILARWHLRRAMAATVTKTGLVLESGPVIPFESIECIVNEGDGFPAVVFVAEDRVKVHIRDKDFVRLYKTILNQWTIDGKKVTVTSGEAGKEPSIEYGRNGKYATFWTDNSVIWLLYIAGFFLVVSLIDFEVPTGKALELFFYMMMGLLIPPLVLSFAIGYFKRVRSSVIGDRLSLVDENKVEHSLNFGDIAAVEKGFFQTIVTAKDGRLLYFPQMCALLPELIEEFAGEWPPSNRPSA